MGFGLLAISRLIKLSCEHIFRRYNQICGQKVERIQLGDINLTFNPDSLSLNPGALRFWSLIMWTQTQASSLEGSTIWFLC